jgi:hypothetical protein
MISSPLEARFLTLAGILSKATFVELSRAGRRPRYFFNAESKLAPKKIA